MSSNSDLKIRTLYKRVVVTIHPTEAKKLEIKKVQEAYSKHVKTWVDKTHEVYVGKDKTFKNLNANAKGMRNLYGNVAAFKANQMYVQNMKRNGGSPERIKVKKRLPLPCNKLKYNKSKKFGKETQFDMWFSVPGLELNQTIKVPAIANKGYRRLEKDGYLVKSSSIINGNKISILMTKDVEVGEGKKVIAYHLDSALGTGILCSDKKEWDEQGKISSAIKACQKKIERKESLSLDKIRKIMKPALRNSIHTALDCINSNEYTIMLADSTESKSEVSSHLWLQQKIQRIFFEEFSKVLEDRGFTWSTYQFKEELEAINKAETESLEASKPKRDENDLLGRLDDLDKRDNKKAEYQSLKPKTEFEFIKRDLDNLSDYDTGSIADTEKILRKKVEFRDLWESIRDLDRTSLTETEKVEEQQYQDFLEREEARKSPLKKSFKQGKFEIDAVKIVQILTQGGEKILRKSFGKNVRISQNVKQSLPCHSL